MDRNDKKAVIFDMDGVLVDNTRYHLEAWRIFLKKHHLQVSAQEFKKNILGRINDEILKLFFKNRLSNTELKKYAAEKERLYRQIFLPHLQPTKGLVDFLEELKKSRIKVALATAAPVENVRFILAHTKTAKYFKNITHMGDIKKGKPNPEIFLKAAKKLKIMPASCIVIEDSLGGIAAAKRAKMKVAAILTTHSRKELGKADLYIKDFSENYRNKILKLLR